MFISLSSSSSALARIAGEQETSTGFRVRFHRWTRDQVIAVAFMSRRVRHGGMSGCGNGERGLVIHQVMREGGGSGQYRMLTKTNYYSWVALMRVNLQARSLWTAVNVSTNDFIDDCNALEAIALGVPPELRGSIASKATAKLAWDSLKRRHLGVDGVRQAMANSCGANYIRSSSRAGSPSMTSTSASPISLTSWRSSTVSTRNQRSCGSSYRPRHRGTHRS